MKALSIRQPWAWLIVNGHKDVENRTWATRHPLPMRIYVHAGKGYDAIGPVETKWIEQRMRDGAPLPTLVSMARGAIIGEVTITGCVQRSGSVWFEGPVGFELTDAVAYPRPIPYKGELGFFEVSL